MGHTGSVASESHGKPELELEVFYKARDKGKEDEIEFSPQEVSN